MSDATNDLTLSQRDSYCRRSTSRVTACSPHADGSFAVLVDDTCLYLSPSPFPHCIFVTPCAGTPRAEASPAMGVRWAALR